MQLETFFKEQDIKEIYDYITIYSKLNYENLPKEWKERFKRKYKNTKENLLERNLNEETLYYYDLQTLKLTLMNYYKIYINNIKLNEPTIKKTAIVIERLIIETLKDKDELTKINFLFDFITHYLDYSTDCYKYCLSVPVVDNLLFDFQKNIPVDNSVPGLLVMHQGICGDISNLMVYLGKKLDLNINEVTCNYNNRLHSLNYITLGDNKNYLIDATTLIKGNKTKEECFLVSKKILNKEHNYKFTDDIIADDELQNKNINCIDESLALIEKINNLIPNTKDINYKKLKRTRT